MEAESQTATLSAGLVALERATATPQMIEPLMRAAHSLKGAARIVGLDTAARVAHAMEDVLVAAQKGKLTLLSEHIDVLLEGVDHLVQVARVEEADIDSWQQEHMPAVDALAAKLTAALDENAVTDKQPIFQVPEPESDPELTNLVTSTPEGTGFADSPPSVDRASPLTPTDQPPAPLIASKTESAVGPARRDTEVAPRRDSDRVVRVTAESLTRLMGFASEALVQSHRLPPLVQALWRFKGRQSGLLQSLQLLEDRLSDQGHGLPAAERELLTKSKAQVSEDLHSLDQTIEAIDEFARTSEDVSVRLHHEVLASRMRPLADGVRAFPRLVRDLGRELGKQAKLEIIGESTGVDRDILDRLEAPINHIIRNALDHGIEPPDERLLRGKPEVATIRLEARHRAGMLQITIADDGRGINLEELRAKVVKRGLTTAAIASRLQEVELLDFLFLPGFSTKEEVTQLSGRGVGLDVVQTMVHSVGGSVRVTSQPGRGTRFIFQLPITVSVIRALLVEIAGEPYAFPLNRIDRILMLDCNDLRELEGKQHVIVDDQPVGLMEATRVFELEVEQTRPAGANLPVVIASDRSHRYGLVVDRFLGERDLRVSPLDPRLGKVPNINSSAVLENGWPVLIVDVEDMIRSIDGLLTARRFGKLMTHDFELAARAPKRILVVDDSITVRELERQLLESRGYSVDIAVDGVDGWNTVRSARYDLVVSDIDMPRMDGIQLVQQIKADARLRSIPVVIVSYKDREEDRIRGLDAGANFYLTKSSFHDKTFLTTVANLIGEAHE